MAANCDSLALPSAGFCVWPAAAIDDSIDDSLDVAVSVLQVKTHLLLGSASLEDTIAMQPIAMDSLITPVTVTAVASLVVFILLLVALRDHSKKQFSYKANKWVDRGGACIDSSAKDEASLGGSNGNHFGSYAMFREMLKHPSATMVKTRLLDFINRFPTGLECHDAALQIHRFIDSMQEWMLSKNSVIVDIDEKGMSNLVEGLEKYVIGRLHHKICSRDDEHVLEDEQMHKHISRLSWVTFEHLGVPPIKPELLALAIEELQRIDEFKAPRDKLVCILNACRVIDEVFKRTIAEAVDTGANGPSRPLSADDFLPMLIYTLIQANPQRLTSNSRFVEIFRHPCLLVAEDAYFFTALQSAIFFVKEIDHEKLEVTSAEFDAFCAKALAAA